MEKKAPSVAVVSRPEVDEELSREQRQRALEAIERIGERNRDRDPDQVLADVTVAVEEVRRERYEAEQRAKAQGSR
jgi:hypothetical protein